MSTTTGPFSSGGSSSTDHGHALQLGVTVPLAEAEPATLPALAAAAEDGGLDLLAVRGADASLDPWTALAWLAGGTSRLTLAATSAPAEVPTVLGRAAASLDLLSDGRLAVGLGVGVGVGSGDPARGDLAPGALAEAVALLRGTWSAGREPLVGPGPRFPVPGAPRGPAPAHDVPVWAAAADPARPLAAAGPVDGLWLDGGATTGSTLLDLDRAAADLAALEASLPGAGRDPREVRRLVTLPAAVLDGAPPGSAPAEALVALVARLVLEHGAGTVLLATADPAQVRRWAQEVAPGVRALVARTRAARGTTPPPSRPGRVRAARRAGIAYDEVPAGIDTVEPGDARYPAMRSTYLRGGRPGLVLLPRDTAEVSRALTWARTQPVPLAIRSGGHGISGRSTNDGGIVLDLRRLDGIEVLDEATRRVRIGPGARWGEVAEALEPYGWAITSGDYGGVGVGGLATAGGLGFLARAHGLTIDHVRAVEVVLADGSVVHADADQDAELFWGVRGAGANLGVVTSFEMEADEVGLVGFAQLAFAVDDLAGYLRDFGALVEASPRDLTPFLIVGRPQRGQVVAQVMAVVDHEDPDTIIERLQPFAMLAPLVQQDVRLVPYSAVVSRSEAHHDGQGEPVTRTALVEHITPELAAAAEALVLGGESFFFQIRSAGGAVNDVPADATAYAHRTAHFSVVAFGADRDRLDRAWEDLARHSAGLYSSFETDRRPERLAEAFPGRTLERLRALKRRVDPDDVFAHNFSVAQAVGAVDPVALDEVLR